MNLVEAEEVGPVEGDAPLVTPPRPPHRRVSVSLLFTATILIGTVVAIYLTFPARHDALMSETIEHHITPPTDWDLVQPAPKELTAWLTGVVGKDVPLPAEPTAIGATRVEIFNRDAALMRFSLGSSDVTYLCQRARGIAPTKGQRRVEDNVVAIGRLSGRITCVIVGPAASEASWSAAFSH